jgi:hypothetical protein
VLFQHHLSKNFANKFLFVSVTIIPQDSFIPNGHMFCHLGNIHFTPLPLAFRVPGVDSVDYFPSRFFLKN